MTPTTLAEALHITRWPGIPHDRDDGPCNAHAAALLALPPDRRAALAAELLDVESLTKALDALPPLPFGLLNEKAIVAMDELPTSRGWAAAILAALKGTLTCRP